LWWSPDIIAGDLKLLYPTDTTMHISHECIYQFIYTKLWHELWENGKWLKQYLLRSHKRRKKKTGRSLQKSSKIPNRIGISERKEVYPECETRNEFGHFEWDSILSVRPTYSALRTELERKSRFLFVRRIPRKTAEHTVQATISIYSSLPKWAVKSTTWDNGTEHAGHELVTQKLSIPIYFAEPYKSWQRGANEHGNGMIRRFFPKGTNFDDVTDEQIQKVVDYINNRPRKILGYKTPKQVFDSYLATFL
jgi:IS30 family transposase